MLTGKKQKIDCHNRGLDLDLTENFCKKDAMA